MIWNISFERNVNRFICIDVPVNIHWFNMSWNRKAQRLCISRVSTGDTPRLAVSVCGILQQSQNKTLTHHFMSSHQTSLYNWNRYVGILIWLDEGVISVTVTVGVCEDVIRRAFEIMSVIWWLDIQTLQLITLNMASVHVFLRYFFIYLPFIIK